MTKTFYKQLIIIFLGVFTLNAFAISPADIDRLDWRLKKSDNNIQVFSAKILDSGHKAVLSTSVINSDIDRIVALIREANTCPQWVYRCKESYRLKSINAQEEIVYTVSDLPFPAKDRDIVAHIKWEQDPNTRVVTATGTATSSDIEAAPSATRIKNAQMIWELTPLTAGQTRVRSFAHVDPAGALPTWLTNRFSVGGPFKTMANLKALLEQSEWHKP